MTKTLVVVESPAKTKTLVKYLGKDFQVLASYGHFRDLPNKKGVDPEQDFLINYQLDPKSKKHIDALVKAAKKVDQIYLATDPDREGEAISWHVLEMLKEKKALKDQNIKRIVFHEITKKAVLDAVANPGELSMNLVDAQQARRALDYLVGFNLSPLLWRKISRGLSAGRVQSPALRLIVEREAEIKAFEAKEYWSIEADLQEQKFDFKAKLIAYNQEPVEQFSFVSENPSMDACEEIKKAANGALKVVDIVKKQRKRNPAPPFITSTLQQEASRKCGFNAQRTMSIAQSLYEGIDVGHGDGPFGIITYMRTDSVNLSKEAIEAMRSKILKDFGQAYLPDAPRTFKTKSKNAQEAHEAIRPTNIELSPESIKQYLNKDQFKLYQLIYKRALASQMSQAIYDTVRVDLAAEQKATFRATGSVIKHPGFMALYLEGSDDDKNQDDEIKLPALEKDQMVTLLDVTGKQHFTEPPPRYSEASLIKTLEEYGIGRPSTYANIIATLKNREYVELEKKRFIPTDMGTVVCRFLTEHFTRYVDYNFTASLEDELDAVSRGEDQYKPLLSRFWGPFVKLIDDIDESVSKRDATQETIDEKCPECSSPLSIKMGRSGRFIGCTNYPDCRYTRSLNASADDQKPEPEKIDKPCPKCSSPLLIRHGRYGKFIGCSAYPKCKHMESLDNAEEVNVTCPSCKKGSMVARKTRRGKSFYSCNRYPDCQYAIWNLPLDQECPNCHWPIMMLKSTKRDGEQIVCPECKFVQSSPKKEDKDSKESN